MKNLYLPSLQNRGVDDFTSDMGIKIRRCVSPAFRLSCIYAFDHKIVVDGYPKLEKDTPYIFASSHGFVEDIQALIATLDRNAYILTGAIDQLKYHPNFYGLWINGFIIVDRSNTQSRKDAVTKMKRIIKSGTSIMMYPEGAWNGNENMLIMPLFKGPYLLASNLKKDGVNTKVVPVAQYKDVENKIIYIKVGEPFDITKYDYKEGLIKLRDEMATLKWNIMEKNLPITKRDELGRDPRYDFMLSNAQEFINGKWVEDLYEDEIIMYKDKNIPYREDILKTFENVKITKDNAHLIAPILAELENEKKYDLKTYMHEYHKNKILKK